MATNFEKAGDSVTWTNGTGSDVTSGSVVVMGNTIGIAAEDIADTEAGTVYIEGTFNSVPKVSAAVFAVGEALIYDVSASAFDDSSATPATGDITGGAIAMVAGANAETTCTVKLTPGNTAVA